MCEKERVFNAVDNLLNEMKEWDLKRIEIEMLKLLGLFGVELLGQKYLHKKFVEDCIKNCNYTI